ncbi:HNH endonuclease signature motif containing protein [Streptomyces griseus]|uniref:HNH endonuclease signature motif containing protein n=1 Tax=Streptomyces griseus TaxID=1911 RepID=UPI0036E49221
MQDELPVSVVTLPTGTGKTLSYLPVIYDGQHRVTSSAISFSNTFSRHPDTPRPLVPIKPMVFKPRRMRAQVSAPATYRAMCRRVLAREQAGRHERRREHSSARRVRDAEARRAVLLRCGNRCENPGCFKADLPYRTSAGEPLLQVDHIDNHATGGRDYPSAMIALCPNCHSNKTYGADRLALTETFRKEAARLHDEFEQRP